ncbi:PREDICTED: uncharacterized protein LOC109359614 [Lupinus angustifolius]|uniref:uncharacterized protein LOC109359614 n=1 Tax=Lupinus angustifolius TaxID=3871 RepID=UPI00092FB20E|nr:PREDICTED: uncharacterized protein LOC109359614 [Lupinus angustifolius]
MSHNTLEGIKGGGVSIKLGTTGTIGSLITRELDEISCTQHKQLSSRSEPRTLDAGSFACGITTPKIIQPRKSSHEASSSGSSGNNIKLGSLGISHTNAKNEDRIPILGSENFPEDRTLARKKSIRRYITLFKLWT